MIRYSIILLGLVVCVTLAARPSVAQEDVKKQQSDSESTAEEKATPDEKATADETAVAKSDQFEDPAEPIDREAERTEGEQDRIRAAAFFAHGRMLQQRGDNLKALRRLQRAWRYDPKLVPIWKHIFPLTRSVKRFDELGRYAILAAEQDPREPEMMLQLAGIAAQNKEHDRAIKLFESAIKLLGGKVNAKTVRAYWDITRLSVLAEDYAKAGEYAVQVQAAIEKPDDFDLKASDIDRLTKDKEKTYRLLAEAYLFAEKYDEAKASITIAYADDEAQRTYHLARILANQDKKDEARDLLAEFFAKKTLGSGVEAYRLYRDLVIKTAAKDADGAALASEKLVALQKEDPANASLATVAAFSLLEQDKADEAAKVLSDSFEIEPTDVAYVGLIEAYVKLKEAKPLLKILADATEKFETLQPLASQTEPIAKDEKLLDELAELATVKDEDDKADEHASMAVAWIALQAGKPELANKMFDQVLAVTEAKQTDLLWQYGLKLYLEDQQPLAQETFQKLLKEKISAKEKQRTYTYLARSLEIDGKTTEAMAAAKRAAVLSSGSPAAKSQLGWITYHAKKYDEAKDHYLRLIDQFDEQTSAEAREVLREARMILSNISVIQEDLPAAEEWLEQVLDEYPEDVGAYNDLGYLWADQNKHLRRAHKMIQRAVADEPDNYAYRDSLGWVLYRLGKFDAAAIELEKAAEADDPDGVVLDHLATVYAAQKRNDKANETWKRALETLDVESHAELHEKISKKIEDLQKEEASN